ncbi:MAG TPA: choice-of-anchor D domain-containing protein, partial [Dokdonella sp.]
DGSAMLPPRVLFEAATPYRASDHDPVLVGLFPTSVSADLAVTVTDTPDPATAGDALTYTLTLSNNGPAVSTAPSLTDALPAGTSFVSLDHPAEWGCTTPAVGATGPEASIACSAATLAVGTVTFTLVVAVDAEVADGTVLTDTAAASASTTDGNPANDSASTTTTVSASADLSIAMTDTPDPVIAGDALIYTITLSNAGPSAAASASFADTLPAGTSFGTLDVPGGWSCTNPAVGSGGTVSCSNASMAPGTAVFNLVVVVDGGLGAGTVLSNTVTAASATADPTPDDHSATASATVQAPAQGHLTIAPTDIDYGQQVVGGPGATASVMLTNDGVDSLDITALTASTAPFARTGGDCGASLPITLAAGAGCSLAYTFAPNEPGPASQSIAVTANVPGSGTILLHGSGLALPSDIAVTVSDQRDFVQAGDTLDYVITVSNKSGASTATVKVSDVLPAALADGSWTCVPTGAATCSSGSGQVLTDIIALPAGTRVTYTYSATVAGDASELIANTAATLLTGGVSDPNPANDSATDFDVVVIFRDGYDDAQTAQPLAAFADAGGFVSAGLAVDASLLANLGSQPVSVAVGGLAGGRSAFTLDLARFGTRYVMRLVMRDASGHGERSEWRDVDLAADALDLAWQSASPGRQDGYLRISAGDAAVQSLAIDASQPLQLLRIARHGDLPWLTLPLR